ncbi:MAG: T9SS type B sorting domain-containing protein, partial [Bacteroidales bacterium]|nr:T9SS type B sorting domain-containing protein [Bacteroidales bacterium]
GCDIGIIKYNEDGTQRLYATYLGGAGGQEMPHSLIVNENNELIMMGTTGSPDFPTTIGAYDNSFNGGDSVIYDNVIAFSSGVDIFVAKLSENGANLLGSTYIGGSGNDGLNFKHHFGYPYPGNTINWVLMHGNDSLYYNYADGARGEVICDAVGDIYVATNTFSNDFPQGINPGYQTNSGGQQDGVVFKLKADLTQLLWSTYLGGNEDDAIYSLTLTEDNKVFVAGGTVSHNFPTTSGAYKTSFQGGTTDGFISLLSANGGQLLASSYYGSDQYDQAYFVKTDRHGSPFICGQTKATGNTLIHNAAYNTPNSGQFIAKFQADLSDIEWSTVFGTGNGMPNISITAFEVDVCDRVYLAGWGRFWAQNYYNSQGHYYTWNDVFGTKGMEITPDAIQPETDGQDFYIMVLSEDASQLEYATFFGELHYPECNYSGRDHVDGGTARFDKKGHIIQSVCASCGNCQEFPTTPGVWSETNGDGISNNNCNNAVFKIRIIENLANASFDPVPVGCAPYDVQFNNHSEGSTFHWDFGDGTTSNEFNPNHTYANSGTYEVMLIVNDPLSCNYADTLVREIFIMSAGVDTLPPIEICPGESVVIGPQGNYGDASFSWLSNSSLNNTTTQNPIASPNQTTNYTLIVNGICNDTIHQTVNVLQPEINLSVSNDTLICPGGTAVLSASSSNPNTNIVWSTSPNITPIVGTGNSITVNPQSTTMYYAEATELECNTSMHLPIVVQIHEFDLSLSPNITICQGDEATIHISNNNSSDILTYSWSPSSSIISGANSAHPVIAPSSTTTYTVSVTNQIGCTTSLQTIVDIDNLMFSTPVSQNPLCFGDCTGTISVSAEGIAPYSYEWDNGDTGEELGNLCAGTYNVTVTDNLQCTATQTITINQPSLLVAQFTDIVQPVCDGVGHGSASLVPDGGTPPYSYAWQFGGTNATNTNLITGINHVTLTDSHGCDTTLNVTMEQAGNVHGEIVSIINPKCYQDCNGSVTVEADSGTPPFTYTWSNGDAGTTISNLCSGTYIVSIVDGENCVAHAYAYIIDPTPIASAIAETQAIKCYGETANVKIITTGGTPNYSFSWSNGQNQQEIANLTPGEYEVTITDANNCKDTAKIKIEQPPQLLMSNEIANMRCLGVCNGQIDVLVEGGTPGYTFNWSSGGNSNNIYNLCEGNYKLTVSDNNDCKIFADFEIINEDYIPDLDAYADEYQVYKGHSTNLHAISNDSVTYQWYPPLYLTSTSSAHTSTKPEKDIEYIIKITDEYGCTNYDTLKINVLDIICRDPFIYIPNAFTPNGDGENDYFKPYAPTNLITKMYFAVFDRWGEIVYESDNINDQGWDGTYKGKILPPDVYVYFFEATCLNQDTYKHKGNVTLIR